MMPSNGVGKRKMAAHAAKSETIANVDGKKSRASCPKAKGQRKLPFDVGAANSRQPITS
jgi:hypothetical protein